MKQLQFTIDLNNRVAIYVPSTMNVDQTINNNGYKLRTLRQLSEMFGGATTTPAVGGWVSASGALVVEHVDIVYSFCTSEQLT